MTSQSDMAPEFSRLVSISEIGVNETGRNIEADSRERAALARRFDLVAIEELRATVHIGRVQGSDQLRLAASLVAEIVQICVVTLEPFSERIEWTFEVFYDPGLDVAAAGEITLDPGDEREIEPLEGDRIDIGEAVAEELALSLHPYPRKPGARIEEAESGVAQGGHRADDRSNPFDVLAGFKPRK